MKKIEQLELLAKKAAKVPAIFTPHDATRMCAPRGEAAQDSFDQGLAMDDSDGGDWDGGDWD